MNPAAAELKACCAAAYGSPAARYLLGNSFHPGGAKLTSELGASLRVGAASVVVDVGSGPGTSAIQVARETGCRVIGIDLTRETTDRARDAARTAGVAGQVEFLEGDAEALPLPDASADGVLSECALCTFPDKQAAAGEIARVLRRGGRLALSDMTAAPERLPEDLRSLSGWVACIGGADRLEALVALLEREGLAVERAEQRDGVLAELLARVEARLRAATILGLPALDGQVGRGLELVSAVSAALTRGELGYAVAFARRL